MQQSKPPDKSSPPTWGKLARKHFRGRTPFLSPNQQCQSTEGKMNRNEKSAPGGALLLYYVARSPWGEQVNGT